MPLLISAYYPALSFFTPLYPSFLFYALCFRWTITGHRAFSHGCPDEVPVIVAEGANTVVPRRVVPAAGVSRTVGQGGHK